VRLAGSRGERDRRVSRVHQTDILQATADLYQLTDTEQLAGHPAGVSAA
jgi:hypothetical protein